MWSHLLNVHVQCTICSATTCSQWLAFGFMRARFVSGIELAKALMKWRILARRSGVQEESKSWGFPWDVTSSSQEVVDKRLRDEEKLWQAVHWIPYLQSVWQVLLQCAGPRCHHVIRTLPPSQSIEYARRHDEGMEQTMGALGLPAEQRAKNEAQQTASLPTRMGGLGLASEFFFREAVVLTNSSASNQPHLRSHSGYGSSHVFSGPH